MEPKKISDFIINYDFASLYPGVMTKSKPMNVRKIEKIEKILKKLNDTPRTQGI